MNRKYLLVSVLSFFVFSLSYAGGANAVYLKSSVFPNGGKIPKQYTCDGADLSPPLSWQDIPAGTQSFVLIMDDPDAPAGVWDHWLLFNIPASTLELPEGMGSLPQGAQAGMNSWGRHYYSGPCPPQKMHRYFFKLYALDAMLALPAGANKAKLEAAMQGRILGQAELLGLYERKR